MNIIEGKFTMMKCCKFTALHHVYLRPTLQHSKHEPNCRDNTVVLLLETATRRTKL